ncbi:MULTISPECIES: hypothetical protein [unclassified Blastococcus]
MVWWMSVLIGWVVLASFAALAVGPAIRVAERRDWVRQGQPERRVRPRAGQGARRSAASTSRA